MFTVYLVRHAQPTHVHDADLRYDIPPGPPLSTTGRMQAAMSADFLRANPPTIIYTSPLERTLQTAQIIASKLKVPLAIDERLAEHRREETSEQVIARVTEFLQQRVGHKDIQRIALVSHGSPIKAMLTTLDDVMVANLEHYCFDSGNIAPHAGIWRARHTISGKWELALIFRTLTENGLHVRSKH